jgi:hypothetical protein
MEDRPVRRSASLGRGSAAIDELHTDWPWLRPTLTFLLGVLIGTIVIAAGRPVAGVSHRVTSTSSSNTTCDQVATDSEQIADLAYQAVNAAQDHDRARLAALQQALVDSQNLFAADIPSCRP